ncbi:TonB-dependent receptor [Myroides sp. LJL116]
MKYNYLTLILTLCLLFLSNKFHGQNSLDSITTLKEIVISKDPFKEIIPVQTLTGENLQKLNTLNVADALRYFSGATIKDYGGMGGLKTIDVRNMGTHHVGVFYNGAAIENAQNGIVDLGKFSLENVEKIQLYNGQRSAIFQSAREFASASVVYIESKKPTFKQNKKININAGYKTGTIQLNNPSLVVDYKVSDKVSTSISTEYIHSNGRYKFRQKRLNIDGSVAYDTTGTRLNSAISAYRIENNWFGKDQNNQWSANLYYYQSSRGLPGAIIKKSDHTIATENINENQKDKNIMVQGHWTRFISDFYSFKLKAKYAYDFTNYLSRKTVDFEGDEVTYNPQFDNTFYQQNYYVSGAHLFKITPIWEVAVSTDFQYDKLNATRKGQGTLFTYPERFTFLSSVATSLDLGKVKAQANVLGTFTHEKVRHNYRAPDRNMWAPSLFLNYKPFEHKALDIHLFYKYIYRLPTFNDLYYTQIGTASLKPELSRQINLGATYSQDFNSPIFKNIHFSLQGYYADITDKIIATPTSSMMRWMMTNLGKVESYGLESFVQADLALTKELNLNVHLTYAYTIAKDKSLTPGGKASYYGDQIPYAPWNSGSAVLSLSYKEYLLNYSFIYVGKRYNANKNNIKRNEVQPWYTHDMSLQKSFTYKEYNFRVTLMANNIANQYYEVVTNFPMPGRNFRLAVNFNL